MKEGLLMKRIFNCLLFAFIFCSFIEVNAECNHEWTEWDIYIETCCSYSGWKSRECTLCGEYEDIEIPKTNEHTWTDWEIWDEPTCQFAGEERRECSVCYEMESNELPATGIHTWTAWEVWDEPDCLNEGKEWRECSECLKDDYKTLEKEFVDFDYITNENK